MLILTAWPPLLSSLWEHHSNCWEHRSSCWEHCSSMDASQDLLVAPQQLMRAPRQLHAGALQQLMGATQQLLGMPAVANHGVVRLISGGQLATLFFSGESPVVHQWQIPPSHSRLHVAGGPPVAFWPLPGVMLSGAVAYGSTGAAAESTVLKHCSRPSYWFIITYIWHIQHLENRISKLSSYGFE